MWSKPLGEGQDVPAGIVRRWFCHPAPRPHRERSAIGQARFRSPRQRVADPVRHADLRRSGPRVIERCQTVEAGCTGNYQQRRFKRRLRGRAGEIGEFIFPIERGECRLPALQNRSSTGISTSSTVPKLSCHRPCNPPSPSKDGRRIDGRGHEPLQVDMVAQQGRIYLVTIEPDL